MIRNYVDFQNWLNGVENNNREKKVHMQQQNGSKKGENEYECCMRNKKK